MRYSLIGVIVLHSCFGKCVQGQGKSSSFWWDARWNRRCAAMMEGRGVPLRDLPIVLSGDELKQLSHGETIAVASLRVVGPGGEVPCQLDEFDGKATVAPNPNHVLDDNDELVFQAHIPATGKTQYWIYWSTSPLPPGKYVSPLLIGDALEAENSHHDIQLWNDECRVGLRGPARGADPTKNEVNNWGAGVLTLLDMYRLPLIIINYSWSWVFPQGCVGYSPCADAARWEKPKELVRGPVRVAAHCFLREVQLKTTSQNTVTFDVEHRVWLYARRAHVCFEEILIPKEPVPELVLNYQHGFGFGKDVGDQFWFSDKDGLKTWAPTAEQIADGGKGSIVFQTAALDPWMAGYSLTEKMGYAVLLDTGESREGEERNPSFHARNHGVLRYTRKMKNLPPSTPVVQRFWIIGWQGESDAKVPWATWQVLRSPPIRFGVVEKGGR